MKRAIRAACLLLTAASLLLCAAPLQAQVDDTPFLAGISDAASLERSVDARLARAREQLDRLLAVKGTRTVDNTLRPFDEMLSQLQGGAGFLSQVHPDEAFRKSAEQISRNTDDFRSQISLNRNVYEALAAIDLSGADAETRFYVERELRSFRRDGVDKDEATRGRINALRRQLVEIQQEFNRNFRNGMRQVVVTDPSELAGLPAEYIARHTPDSRGVITLTTEVPDSGPVMSYAKSEALRKRMYLEVGNVGYPANVAVLDRMIATRAELAKLLGFANWADYDADSRMASTGENAAGFIDQVVAASGPKADREYAQLLARKRQDVPGATVVNRWEQAYYSELVRQASYGFDSQALRDYLPYDRVRQGVFDVTSRLFGLTYRPAAGVPVWDPSVEVFDVLENGTRVGRFYLDMHVRPGKGGSGASTSTIRTGVAGRQLSEGALVCRFPGGRPGDPGLMSQDNLRTFFHEFGHLIHAIVAGHHQWVGIGGIRTERDFVEAPSQMLESWITDPPTLATFARHYRTNEPVPAALVNRMRRADEFGKGLNVRNQMVLAKLSLSMHDRDPRSVDTTAMLKGLTREYVPFPFVDGIHTQTSFTHLGNPGYASAYYTYQWSLVIAKDLFSQFDGADLLAPGVARRYRDTVLAPGGSKPAAALIGDFLGRPFNFKAWEAWLNLETP